MLAHGGALGVVLEAMMLVVPAAVIVVLVRVLGKPNQPRRGR